MVLARTGSCSSQGGKPVAPELTPVEARSGVVSGRVISVLIVSSIGALAALSAIWWFAAR